jgi:inosine-uridine nucleoside N-ribohydrolase
MPRLLVGVLLASLLVAAGRDTVVFDTDSGLFGDDGAALVMLLRSPQQVSMDGITLVPGNVWPLQAAEYTFHILDLLRRPLIPVYSGAQMPLLHTPEMAKEAEKRWGALNYTGAFAMNPESILPATGTRISLRKAKSNAVAFLISEIERKPGEVTVLALGPMTNIAMALRLRPDLETKIKRIVFMGGAFHVPGNASSNAEFNFWFDPEAARIVLRSRIPKKIMFALDICNQAAIHKAEFDQVAGARTGIASLYREDLGNHYPGFLKHPDAVAYMWDSLVAAYLLDPDLVTSYETRYLDVQSSWGQAYGATVPLDRRLAPAATPVTFMLTLDFKRAFALYRDKLVQPDPAKPAE